MKQAVRDSEFSLLTLFSTIFITLFIHVSKLHQRKPIKTEFEIIYACFRKINRTVILRGRKGRIMCAVDSTHEQLFMSENVWLLIH